MASSALTPETKYLKRFRMEIDFRDIVLERPVLPEGYHWEAWTSRILDAHSLTKFESFHAEMDSQIFPALRTVAGCRDLMKSIAEHRGFLPQSTWLIKSAANEFRPGEPCGTIQGLVQDEQIGAIQNVGVIPSHRGLGLGKALVLKNLHNFRSFGIQRVYLDVSALNRPAIRLYEAIGFRHKKTSYREIVLPLESTS